MNAAPSKKRRIVVSERSRLPRYLLRKVSATPPWIEIECRPAVSYESTNPGLLNNGKRIRTLLTLDNERAPLVPWPSAELLGEPLTLPIACETPAG